LFCWGGFAGCWDGLGVAIGGDGTGDDAMGVTGVLFVILGFGVASFCLDVSETGAFELGDGEAVGLLGGALLGEAPGFVGVGEGVVVGLGLLCDGVTLGFIGSPEGLGSGDDGVAVEVIAVAFSGFFCDRSQ
jgi:hypothetical protein